MFVERRDLSRQGSRYLSFPVQYLVLYMHICVINCAAVIIAFDNIGGQLQSLPRRTFVSYRNGMIRDVSVTHKLRAYNAFCNSLISHLCKLFSCIIGGSQGPYMCVVVVQALPC